MVGYCIISYDMVSRVVYLVLLGGESRRLFGNHLAPSPSINLDMNAKSVSILFGCKDMGPRSEKGQNSHKQKNSNKALLRLSNENIFYPYGRCSNESENDDNEQ